MTVVKGAVPGPLPEEGRPMSRIHVPHPTPEVGRPPSSLEVLAQQLRGESLTEAQRNHIRHIQETDWSRTRLDIASRDHRDYAARGIALGASAIHGFGNFYAVTMLPDTEVIEAVNRSKGRPTGKTASAYPVPEQIKALDSNNNHPLFDMSHLPDGMEPAQVVEMMDKLYELGPFGFRGRAALLEYPSLVSPFTGQDGDTYYTLQIIAPGYQDEHSNDMARQAMKLSGAKVLGITSANRSHHITNTAEEPAHWEMHKIMGEFGDSTYPYMMIGHHEREALARYPDHRPMSTSIIGFHEKTSMTDGRPTVTLERHGSLHVERIAEVLDELGINLTIGKGGVRRLGERPRDTQVRGRIQETLDRRRAPRIVVPVFPS